MNNFHAAVIAGTHSGVGKTTWSLALMAFFQEKGLKVQPFKVGPDYIDPGFHSLVCSPCKSRNLDRFFLSPDYLKQCFEKNCAGADAAIVEGVMGLYDGKSPVTEEGSTAEMAKLLNLPVFLVVDAAGIARSAAAIVKGYQSFDPELNLAGVLLNRVGSEGHYEWLCQSIEETGVPVLGWLPANSKISIPERYLGLQTALEEEERFREKLIQLTGLLKNHFDSERFLELSRRGVVSTPENIPGRGNPAPTCRNGKSICRIGAAYDRAFSFYYQDNFDLLEKQGAEIIYFSPLLDQRLPENLDALYLGGGFPEIFARELSQNEGMKASIQKFYEEGGLFYAECGGLIYLSEALIDPSGTEIPLLGLVPGKIVMSDRLQNFGYHEIETRMETFLFEKGKKFRSHEFHYSIWNTGENFKSLYQINSRMEGFYNGQILASYQHLHFGQDPRLAENFVQFASYRPKAHVHSNL